MSGVMGSFCDGVAAGVCSGVRVEMSVCSEVSDAGSALRSPASISFRRGLQRLVSIAQTWKISLEKERYW